MGEIQRPGALYQQVAAEIRNAIAAGEFPPGAPLPSESQLIERYKVSRPTVRNAISALRSEGLIEVIHGKGSYVRALPTPTLTIEQTIHQDAGTYALGHRWEQAEEPATYRSTTTAITGPLLELAEGEAVFGTDRLLVDPASSTRAMHRLTIPFCVAEGTPLADAPDTEPEQIYALLTKAGHELTWTETVSARMPKPDERTTLDIPEATPVIHTTRITRGTATGPLILEELHTSAARVQLTYHITAAPGTTARAGE
ncbi:GntR family transcriptional regulator [Streptomyces sp. NPDC053079]|uniref:GntR family transcriptional regulator n=1 Tax=Streptomyces sp. NPDC053079 TaxID=3365697 RepID=UPI0037CD6625